jgi:hypothetical protein
MKRDVGMKGKRREVKRRRGDYFRQLAFPPGFFFFFYLLFKKKIKMEVE